jgi:gamma-glutamyltranspeptidase / glutathione hydrolase
MRAVGIRSLAGLVLAILLSAPGTMTAQDRPSTMAGRSTVYAPRGAVATSQPLASGAALGILQRGGNAIDAAVAAAAVLNVTEPHMTGMGGDMFAILWSAEENRLVGLDASGRAGSLVSPEVLRAKGHEQVPYRGPEAVTVPGALSGWAALIERFGTMTLAEVLAPAIRIAEEGFPVTPIISRQWRETAEVLRQDEGATKTFLYDGTRGPAEGEWFRNPDLAASFRAVAEDGPDAFYSGPLGERVVKGLQALGGYLTLDDLRRQEVRWVDPISAEFHGYTVWELPPAGQGVAALQMLKMLEPYDLESMGHNSAQYLHTLIEAKKLAYADLGRYVADPDFMEVSSAELLDDEYVAARGALINPKKAAERPDPGKAATESETIYLSVTDSEGNMISFINSIFEYFGSGVVIPGTGFALQNRGAGFTLEDGHPNQIAAGKRPFHTIIPGFVTRDGSPWMTFGLMGGSMQPQGHTQMLINMIVFGMDVQAAIDAPRFRHFSGLTVALEAAIGEDVRSRLRVLGHEIRDETGVAFGGAQAIQKLLRGWSAGSDSRKDGMAVGH